MAHAGGRPRIYNAEDINKALTDYIDNTEQPFIQEFCLNSQIDYDTLDRYKTESQEISQSIKKLLAKQELYIVKNASTNTINPIFSMFRLKQKCFGWTDKQDIAVTAATVIDLSDRSLDDLKRLLAESND